MARAGLSPERVVDEAAQLADEVGTAGLSLAALAGRLGVKVPSLYKHVASLDGVRQAISVRAKAELADAIGAAAIGLSRGEVIFSALAGYDLTREQTVDATRMLRASLHGFIALEAAGGFMLPLDVDRSFAVMVTALDRALCDWP